MDIVSNQKTILGEFLLKLRLKKGWSLCDLEKETGFTASYLHRLEKGVRKNPTVTIVHALAKAYSVEVATLIDLVLLEQDEEKDVE